VRVHAFRNDKADDDFWIAKQIYPCFRGKALRWYLKQPRNVREDWELLQQALTQEWPLVEEESSIQPTPAAAPSPSTDLGVSSERAKSRGAIAAAPRTGIISVRLTGDSTFLGYLSKRLSDGGSNDRDYIRGSFTVTTDKQESLKVMLHPTQTPGVWRLGVKDFPEAEYLAAYFCGPDFKSWTGAIIGVRRAPTGWATLGSTTYAATSPSFQGHVYHTDVWEIGNQVGMTCRWPDQVSGSPEIHFPLSRKVDLLLQVKWLPSDSLVKAELVFVDSPF